MDKVHPVEGPWIGFTFKMIQPEDFTRILQYMREFMYYPSLAPVGYEKGCKELDDEYERRYEKLLKTVPLQFYVEDNATGEIAGARMITVVNKWDPPAPSTYMHPRSRAISAFHSTVKCEPFEMYPEIDKYALFLGVCVTPKYQRHGLATEMYRRALLLLKENGFKVGLAGFCGPYSRAAAIKNGWKEVARKRICEGKDLNGQPLNPSAHPDDYSDVGIFLI